MQNDVKYKIAKNLNKINYNCKNCNSNAKIFRNVFYKRKYT